ncbi:hypothetical protein [Komagataeibacter europaeus]|uniref:hypothetical protein n=1 Tax=Komagataeibacter europaeus TaxID=33995 RepID=UPI000381A2B8
MDDPFFRYKTHQLPIVAQNRRPANIMPRQRGGDIQDGVICPDGYDRTAFLRQNVKDTRGHKKTLSMFWIITNLSGQ